MDEDVATPTRGGPRHGIFDPGGGRSFSAWTMVSKRLWSASKSTFNCGCVFFTWLDQSREFFDRRIGIIDAICISREIRHAGWRRVRRNMNDLFRAWAVDAQPVPDNVLWTVGTDLDVDSSRSHIG